MDEIAGDLDANEKIDEKTKKLMTVLERKRRKLEKIERKKQYANNMKSKKVELDELTGLEVRAAPKYVDCGECKNPRGASCAFGLCRKCCKQKVFTDELDCKGHNLKFRAKIPTTTTAATLTINESTI